MTQGAHQEVIIHSTPPVHTAPLYRIPEAATTPNNSCCFISCRRLISRRCFISRVVFNNFPPLPRKSGKPLILVIAGVIRCRRISRISGTLQAGQRLSNIDAARFSLSGTHRASHVVVFEKTAKLKREEKKRRILREKAFLNTRNPR